MAHKDVVREQIDGVERFLQLETRSRVLDLGCGPGRQTIELARRGHRVLGIDPSEKVLQEARQAARAERLNVHFLKNDMRQIPYRADFDAVVCFSSSFGRLTGERDDERALVSVAKALKPGGWLLLDMLNKEWLMRHFEPNTWEPSRERRADVLLDQVSFNFETGRLDNHRTLLAADGSRKPIFISLRVYTLTELKALVARAGLTYAGGFGGFDGSAYGMDSERLIVLARRPVEERKRKREDDELPTALRIKGRSKRR